MDIKLKWRVQEVPTGKYRSFEKRGWPDAQYADGSPAVQIVCDDEYDPRNVQAGTHAPLKVMIADYSASPSWKWRILQTRGRSLTEAKTLATNFLNRFPSFAPKHR